MTVIFPTVVVAGGRPTVTLTDYDVSNAYNASQDFTVDVGAVSSRRTVFIATYRPTVTGVSVDGGAATLIVDSAYLMKIWRATGVAGTTATVTVTSSGGGFGAFICVWAAYNLRSTTPYDSTVQFDSSNVTTTPCNVDVESKGIIIGVAASARVGISSASWSGIAETSEQKDGATLLTSACSDNLAASSPLSIGITWDVSSIGKAIAASFR